LNRINNCSNWVVYLGYNNFIDWTLVRVWSECVLKQEFELQNWSYDWSECWIVGRVIGCEKIGHRLGHIFIIRRPPMSHMNLEVSIIILFQLNMGLVI